MNLVRITVLLTLLSLLLFPFSVKALPVLDLAELSERNRVLEMEILSEEQGTKVGPGDILYSNGWLSVRDVPELLSAPRRKTVIWLRTRVQNGSPEPVQRWLELSPWRLNRIDTWLIDPLTGQLNDHISIGLDQPISARRVPSNRAVVPLNLPAGHNVDLLIRIDSDSRPFLFIKNWDPISFTTDQAQRYQFHSILLAITLTLAVVLLFQANVRYTLVCLWMLSLFVFEAEKEAYISYLLFDGLADYASHLRFSFSVIAKSLFMLVSVYLLGLNRHQIWRWMLPVTLLFSLSYTGLTFVLEDNQLRNSAMVFHIAFALVWPLLLPAALRQKRRLQNTILLLLGVGWLTNSIYVFSYALNINYTSEMATVRLLIEIFQALALLLIYALQKRNYERSLEQQLRDAEQSERARLELAVAERTRELNLALDAAQKSDAKTRFLSRVTHDLKSPLTSIMGYAQLLSVEQGKIGQKSRIIHSSASHMLNLINRLINYARDVKTLEVVQTDLYTHAFISDIAYEGRILAGKNNNGFRLEVDELLPSVIRCDETLLREVLLNLLDNAAKYTVNGDITLRIYDKNTHESDKGSVLQLVCEVEDTGCGIDAEEHDQLFDPFFRVSDNGEGTGLGLAIVKELVERMEGDIFLSSVPNKGTCVRFTVPVKPGREDAGIAVLKSPTRMLPLYNADGLEAWVVEDSEQIRHLLYTELSELGFAVETFADAESAINALQAKITMPDIILTDYRLPKASGGAVLEAARAIDPLVPVLLLSATWYLQPERQETGECYTALLGKPVDLALLRHEVARACGLADIQASNSSEAHSSGSVTASSIVINEDSIQQLEVWLELGAVTDITEWCEQLGKQHPESACFAEELSALAQRGDFKAIHRRLLELG